MNTSKNPPPKSEKFPPQQTDITIDADGKIHLSFLWDDLRGLPGALVADTLQNTGSLQPRPEWHPPLLELSADHVRKYESCSLCPKECGFNRWKNAHPTCGDWKLRVSNSGITYGDEPEIRGQTGSGAIMLSGCPLKCPSCHNPEKVADGTPVSPLEFLEICKSLYDRGAENIQILSPTVHLAMLIPILTALKKNSFPIPIVFKSSGYENLEQLKALDGLVDVYLPDLKFGSCSLWSKRAGVRDYFEQTKAAISEMIKQTGALQLDSRGVAKRGVLVRHVEAPLPESEKAQILAFLSLLPEGVAVSIQNTFVSLE